MEDTPTLYLESKIDGFLVEVHGSVDVDTGFLQVVFLTQPEGVLSVIVNNRSTRLHTHTKQLSKTGLTR